MEGDFEELMNEILICMDMTKEQGLRKLNNKLKRLKEAIEAFSEEDYDLLASYAPEEDIYDYKQENEQT